MTLWFQECNDREADRIAGLIAQAKHVPPAQVLPYEAAKALQEAACTPVLPSDPSNRKRAIEHAIARVRQTFPQYFKQGDPA